MTCDSLFTVEYLSVRLSDSHGNGHRWNRRYNMDIMKVWFEEKTTDLKQTEDKKWKTWRQEWSKSSSNTAFGSPFQIWIRRNSTRHNLHLIKSCLYTRNIKTITPLKTDWLSWCILWMTSTMTFCRIERYRLSTNYNEFITYRYLYDTNRDILMNDGQLRCTSRIVCCLQTVRVSSALNSAIIELSSWQCQL